jgi:hypothetical protein
MEYPIFYIHVEPYIVGKLGYISQLLMRYYCNLKSVSTGTIFSHKNINIPFPPKKGTFGGLPGIALSSGRDISGQ